MSRKKFLSFLAAVVIVAVFSGSAMAAELKEIKVGLLYSLTGPLAPGGGTACYRGNVIAIDVINDRGGVMGKYKIVPVIADAQSNPDIAVREVERLISVEKCSIIMGSFSSGIAVPAALTCEKNKVIWWNTAAVSDGVLKGKHYKYAFRTGPVASDFGRAAMKYLYSMQGKLGFKKAADMKVATITEDGPYGSLVREGNREEAKKLGIPLVFDDSYSHTAKDLSAIILKMKASGAEVICNAGYAPDILLFQRELRELGVKTRAMIGEGTLYNENENMAKSLGKEAVNLLHNVDICPLQLIDPRKLTPENRVLQEEFMKRALAKFNDPMPAGHYTYTYSSSWFLFDNILPLTIKEFGEVNPETVRQACMKINVPDGQTMMGYGIKFEPPESEFAGQNLRAFPVVTQWIDGKQNIVYPESLRVVQPILPLPSSHPLGK